MYRESDLDAQQLYKILSQLLDDVDKLQQMGYSMNRMGQPEATQHILENCIELIRK
jgi:UDP-N-acetylglucosamine:LPS N-acetylglucosamine transferase